MRCVSVTWSTGQFEVPARVPTGLRIGILHFWDMFFQGGIARYFTDHDDGEMCGGLADSHYCCVRLF